ncbi:hypothetical protein [Parabacteroides sp.]|uniref:InlB B-repeat-containing protein n=1 Tax=Parabacteroides sp. TaxID=1869337 RepID=UPI00257BB35A|nr:hypothetical protein [Parabacteroides sp.]
MNVNHIKQLFVALFLLLSAGTATAAQWMLKKTDLNAAGSKDTLALGVYGNSFGFSSFQVDFTLPEGVLPDGAPILGDIAVDHALTWKQENGSYRCVVYSPKNTEMKTPEGYMLYLPVELAASFKEGTFTAKNGLLSNKKSEGQTVPDMTATLRSYKEKADLVVNVSGLEKVVTDLNGNPAELSYTTVPEGKKLTVGYFKDDSCKVEASNEDRTKEGILYVRLFYAGDADYNTFEKVYVMSLTSKKAIATSGIIAPMATSIKEGQLLSASLLSGGSVTDADGYTVAGTFAWTDGSIVVPAGEKAYSVTFYPDNAAYYATVSVSVQVKVAKTFTITAVASTGGVVNVLGKTEDNKYVEGHTVSLKAIPLPNYQFDGWSVTGSSETLSTGDSIAVAVDTDKTYTANFSPIMHALSIAVEGHGSLSVTAEGNEVTNGVSLQQGTVLQILATPDMNAQLKDLTINGDSLKGDKVTLTGDLEVKAVFEAKPVEKALVTIEKVANGSIILYNAEGSPIASGSTVDKNAKVKAIALPNAGYQLSGKISLSDAKVESGAEYTVTGDIIATATFVSRTYKVTASAVSSNPNETKPAGTITLEPAGDQPYGTEVRIASIEGQNGARLLTILANGKEVSRNEVLTVTGDLTVTAVFDHRVDIKKEYIMWPYQSYYYNGVSRNFVPFASQTYAGFSFDVKYRGTDMQVRDKAIDADNYTVLLHRDEDGLYNEFNEEYAEGLVIKKSKIAVTQAPNSSSENPKTRPGEEEVTVTKNTVDQVTTYTIEPKSEKARKNYLPTTYYFSERPAVALNFGSSILRSGEKPKGSVRVTNGGLALEQKEGGFSINAGVTVTLEAVPAEGYKFTKWSDGNMENPREYAVTAGATGVTPEFAGKPKTSFALLVNTSTYDGTAQTVSVTGEGSKECQITFFADEDCQQPAILKNAGKYYVRVYRPEDDHYQAYTQTFEYTIESAEAEVTWPTASEILSGHALAESVLQGGHAGIVAGTFAWSDQTQVMTATGEQEVIFTPTDPNYKSQSSKVSVTVVSATSTSTDPENPTDPTDPENPTDPTDPTDPDTPTGVESIEEGMALYAANQSILANLPRQATLTVVDVAGIIVYQETVTGEVMIPVGHAGVYFVRCEAIGESFVRKIVVR